MKRLTKKEKEWISELEEVLDRMPEKLMLFADGRMHILKPLKGGDPNCMKLRPNGCVYDMDCIVRSIVCNCDGGSF